MRLNLFIVCSTASIVGLMTSGICYSRVIDTPTATTLAPTITPDAVSKFVKLAKQFKEDVLEDFKNNKYAEVLTKIAIMRKEIASLNMPDNVAIMGMNDALDTMQASSESKISLQPLAVPESRQGIAVSDPLDYIAQYKKSQSAPKKTQFETDDEYKQRLPKPANPLDIKYFEVMADPVKTLINEDTFAYDLKSNVLTLTRGIKHKFSFPGEPVGSLEIDIAEKRTDLKPYTGTNSYGASVDVDNSMTSEACMVINNPEAIPDGMFDRDLQTLSPSIVMAPKDAEALSASAEVIIGVRVTGDDLYEYLPVYYHKPTIDEAYDSVEGADAINVYISKIIIMNKTTRKIVKEWSSAGT